MSGLNCETCIDEPIFMSESDFIQSEKLYPACVQCGMRASYEGHLYRFCIPVAH